MHEKKTESFRGQCAEEDIGINRMKQEASKIK